MQTEYKREIDIPQALSLLAILFRQVYESGLDRCGNVLDFCGHYLRERVQIWQHLAFDIPDLRIMIQFVHCGFMSAPCVSESFKSDVEADFSLIVETVGNSFGR